MATKKYAKDRSLGSTISVRGKKVRVDKSGRATRGGRVLKGRAGYRAGRTASGQSTG